jgi:hypothetical protein
VVYLDLLEFKKKIRNNAKGKLGAQGNMIYEENLKTKIT